MTPKPTQCCDVCRTTTSKPDSPHAWSLVCKNKGCPCHSAQEDWREEFEKKFYLVGTDERYLDGPGVRDEIKSFISSVEKKAIEGERHRLKQKAEQYKAKGFELETFIYSGFLPDLFPSDINKKETV